MNPILQNLTQNNVAQMMNMVRTAKNPNAMLNQLAQSNPQMKQAMDLVNSGADPKTLFYKMAQQKGIDPNSVLNMLR